MRTGAAGPQSVVCIQHTARAPEVTLLLPTSSQQRVAHDRRNCWQRSGWHLQVSWPPRAARGGKLGRTVSPIKRCTGKIPVRSVKSPKRVEWRAHLCANRRTLAQPKLTALMYLPSHTSAARPTWRAASGWLEPPVAICVSDMHGIGLSAVAHRSDPSAVAPAQAGDPRKR